MTERVRITRTSLRHVRAASMLIAAAALSVSALPALAAGADMRLMPHRVLYNMTLGHAEQGASVSDARGTMFYRFEPSCDGWEVETRVSMRLHYGPGEDADVVQTTWSYSSFESYDGKRFVFDVEHNRDGEPLEAFSGKAKMDDTGGSADFDNPDGAVVTLPVATIFPGRHLTRLLAKARAGEMRYIEKVFDGASINNPYEVNSFIVGQVVNGNVARDQTPAAGPMHARSHGVPEAAGTTAQFRTVSVADLPASPVWRVRMAYFPIGSPDVVPEFEIEVDYREDGVAQHIVQDFGDFTLNVTPTRFEALPYPKCQ